MSPAPALLFDTLDMSSESDATNNENISDVDNASPSPTSPSEPQSGTQASSGGPRKDQGEDGEGGKSKMNRPAFLPSNDGDTAAEDGEDAASAIDSKSMSMVMVTPTRRSWLKGCEPIRLVFGTDQEWSILFI